MVSEGEGIINPETGLLSFTEKQEDGGTVVNIVRIYSDKIEIKKSGQVKSDMSFVKRTEAQGSYRTPFGEHALTIYTRKVTVTHTPQMVSIFLDYTLKMDGQYIGDTELTMTATYIE